MLDIDRFNICLVEFPVEMSKISLKFHHLNFHILAIF